MKLLDVVATLEDLPAVHLAKGQVGTIVDELSDEVVLVEFADLGGVTYAIEAIPIGQLIELRHSPAMAA
jgi:hypothetical protein